jgi:hypothetical protein
MPFPGAYLRYYIPLFNIMSYHATDTDLQVAFVTAKAGLKPVESMTRNEVEFAICGVSFLGHV